MESNCEHILSDAKGQKIGEIYVKKGDQVKPGDSLLEIEQNKGTKTLAAEISGTIADIRIAPGDVVDIGDLLLVIKPDFVINSATKLKAIEDNVSHAGLSESKKRVECDLAILGGGPGGYVAALQAAKMGAKTVIIEKDNIGGTCLNRGCIPTKALFRSAEVLSYLKKAATFGLKAENISPNMSSILARKNRIVSELRQGVNYLLDRNHVIVIAGTGQIVAENKIQVNDGEGETEITAGNIIIATGSKAITPQIPGIDLPGVISSNEALNLNPLPSKMIIVGGGIIGMEFASIYAHLGVEVTVIEASLDILTLLDKDVREEILGIALVRGINIQVGSRVDSIMAAQNGEYIVAFSSHNSENNQKKYLIADKVLLAVGREPYYSAIDIKKIGIEYDEIVKGIKVNGRMQTNIANIYAIGDVTNIIQLAHVASHQGLVAVKNIIGEHAVMDYTAVPNAIFTDPEIGTVGLGEEAARKRGYDIAIGKFPFTHNGKALTLGETKGFVKIIKNKANDKIIGASIIGPNATDLIAGLTLAVKNGLNAEQITRTIYAHPTTAEAIHEAALATSATSALHYFE